MVVAGGDANSFAHNKDDENRTLNAESSLNANFNELQSLLESLPILPKEGWERKRLSDSQIFSLNIGKRVLDSELNPSGQIPVYSANVKKPFGFVDKEILQDYKQDSVLWGIDGDWLVGFIPKNTPFYPTDHCGVLRVKGAKAKIMAYCLEEEGKRAGFSRALRASIERISALSIVFPPLEAQETIVSAIEVVESKIARIDSSLESLEKEKANILNKILNNKQERETRRNLNKSYPKSQP